MRQIGFMQGRLCDQVDGQVQAFPWRDWKSEFPAAASLGIKVLEWTLDHERLYENPLLTASGRFRIQELVSNYRVSIPSLTGDCFMQAPFWKAEGAVKEGLQTDFLAVCRASHAVGIGIIVVPLVDNGRLENAAQENELVAFMLSQQNFFNEFGIRIAFESDFTPRELHRFIEQLPAYTFGINYDIGNSAALGFDPVEELERWGHRVLNVHVKDRMLGGHTVPLTSGDARFDDVFGELARVNYMGNFILQTARATDGRHVEALRAYRDTTLEYTQKFGLVAP